MFLCALTTNREFEGQKDDDFERRLTEKKEYQRVVVDLDSKLETWLNKADPNDGIRVISGGPGSGKSSFAKIFAAKQAEKGKVRVFILFLYIYSIQQMIWLMQLVNLLIRILIKFIPPNPLLKENAELRLLIVFDGLDELAMQGKVAKEVAQQFVREVEKQVYRFNSSETRLQVLITGRELIVQANSNEFRKRQQVLHVLTVFCK